MSRLAAETTWFPEELDANRVVHLSILLQETARLNGFSRETFAAAIAQMAEGITGCPPELDIDATVRRFVGERLLAAGAALAEVN